MISRGREELDLRSVSWSFGRTSIAGREGSVESLAQGDESGIVRGEIVT